TSGCAAGACWRRPRRRSTSSTWRCNGRRISRPSDPAPHSPMARCGSVLAALSAGLALAMPGPAAAEPDFYSGKSIQVLIGFSAGGGYDVYARTLARHMGRHIPGNPRLVPQNMPGAGSLKAANYLYNVAPRDGTAIGTFAPGMAVEPLLGRGE